MENYTRQDILRWYEEGWHHDWIDDGTKWTMNKEFDCNPYPEKSLQYIAWNHGKVDRIAGDDCTSVDCQTDDERIDSVLRHCFHANNIVSFDFEDCLENVEVQEYAKELSNRGFSIVICTCRSKSENAPWQPLDYNYGLFKIARGLVFRDDRDILFCGSENKYDTLLKYSKNILFHLDSNSLPSVKVMIGENGVNRISYSNNQKWKEECESVLNGRDLKKYIVFSFGKVDDSFKLEWS